MGIVKQGKSFTEKKPRGRPPKYKTVIVYTAMDFLRKVEPLQLDGNVAENWRTFKQNFDYFFIAAELNKKSDEVQAAVLLNAVGPEAVELFNSFNLDANSRKKYSDVVAAFEAFCIPKKNAVYASFVFHNRNQAQSEPFDAWLMHLKKLVKPCDFGAIDQENRMLRDRIVIGIADKIVQKKMLETEGLTADKAIEMARLAEVTKRQADNLQHPQHIHTGRTLEALSVGKSNLPSTSGKRDGSSRSKQWRAVSYGEKPKHHGQQMQNNLSSNRYEYKKSSTAFNNNFRSSNKQSNYSGSGTNCVFCGKNHVKGRCLAFGKKCANCGKLNHFATVCKNRKQIGEVTGRNVSDDTFYIDSILNKNYNELKSAWIEKIKINNRIIPFKLDTGAEVNVLPLQFVPISDSARVVYKNIRLEGYGGSTIKVKGVVNLKCMTDRLVSHQDFVIVENGLTPLLGLQGCIELGLVKRINEINAVFRIETKEELLRKFSTVFEGLGKFPVEYKIVLKKGSVPIAKSARRVPLSILKPLQRELNLLCEKKIIECVDEAVEWVSNLVVVEKRNKTLRLCLDPKHLNEVIVTEPHIIPTFEDISVRLANMKYFTVLDLKEGYWQVQLDEQSSKLCTFATPFGCFQFNRLPFGIKSAPEAFQKLSEKMFGDIDGTVVYIDDILVGGKTLEEHDRNLAMVMKRALDNNIKFNKEKVQFRVSKVNYLGHVIGAEGIQVDPDRMTSIIELKSPTDKKELERLLGMVNYMRQFIPDLSDLSQPLRELVKTRSIFNWQPVHENSLNEIKKRIAHAPTLKPFDVNKDITIQADASKFGLGCCLMQQNKPVSFASRSLTQAECNYGQIDKEMLAIVFACSKYHRHISRSSDNCNYGS